MRFIELAAPEGCTPAAELTHEQRVSLFRLAMVEFVVEPEFDSSDSVDRIFEGPFTVSMRTRYPVLIQDRPGGGYVVAEKCPVYIWPKEEGGAQ